MEIYKIYEYKRTEVISERHKYIQVKSKGRIFLAAIICLFCFQLFLELAAAMDGMSDQGKIEAQTVQTLESQPANPNLDEVLAIPGLPLKLRPGSGCADHANYSLSRHLVATHPFKIEEICFGDTKGPDIKRDFKWFMISGKPIDSGLRPGLVLSLYIVNGSLGWKESNGGMTDWSLIEKLPKFTVVGLKNYRTQKSKSFKWREKVYDCADSKQAAPPGFRRVSLYDYCWFEKTTGPDILSGSF
jgi:hypothetical protein